jgi:hypothetical protein
MKTRVFERACIVAQQKSLGSIFEGNMPLKKIHPQKWPLYDDHSMKAVDKLNQSKLSCEDRLDRSKINRNRLKLGLQQKRSKIINERICKKALKEYQHKPPPKPFDAPTKYHKPEFGQKIQYERTDESKPLSPKQIKQYKRYVVENFYTQVEQ